MGIPSIKKVEPIPINTYLKSNGSGNKLIVHPYFQETKRQFQSFGLFLI